MISRSFDAFSIRRLIKEKAVKLNLLHWVAHRVPGQCFVELPQSSRRDRVGGVGQGAGSRLLKRGGAEIVAAVDRPAGGD